MKFFIFLIFTTSAIAASVEKKYVVETSENVSSEVKAAHPDIQFKNSEIFSKSHLPDLRIRNQYFHKIDITSKITQLDELDRDVLYWRLNHLKLSELKKYYPRFSNSIWENWERKKQ